MKKIKVIISGIFFLIVFCHLNAQDAVMHFTDLQNFLPDNIPGYAPGEPGGSTMEMQEMSFSSADIEFTRDDGSWVRVTILDYSGAASMYQAATAVWTAGMSIEDGDTKARTVQFSNEIVGWEEFRKNSNEAYLALGIGQQFFLSIEANKQSDVSFVNEIAENMDLDDLLSE